MAPPSGPRGATAATTRSTRSMTGASRGGHSRGGIAKRGRDLTKRVDRDGDLDMDAAGKAGAGINKRGHATTRRGTTRSSAPQSINVTRLQQNLLRQMGDVSQIPSAPRTRSSKVLKVHGLKESKAATNPDGGVKNLLEFLERKAHTVRSGHGRPVTVKKSHVAGDFVYIMVSNEDAEDILKLNSFTFAGAPLTITVSDEGWPSRHSDRQSKSRMSSQAQQDQLKLQAILERRYNPNAKLLDLSALGQDADLAQMGLFGAKNTAEKTFKVFMKICRDLFKTEKQKREAIESISIACNNIDFVGQVFDLAETFPDLKNLDLSNNLFSSLKQLSRWRGRFRHLETLLLNNNPITQSEPGYAHDILAWFPKLQNLSGIQVRTPEQVVAEEAAARPILIPQKGTDFRDVANLGEQFLRQFFPLYDSDRNALLAMFYDEHSTFTLAVANYTPKGSAGPALPWAPYLKFSRNQMRITTTGGRISRYFVGVKIQETWKDLPVTKHPDLATNLNKYLIDCHPMQGLADPAGLDPKGVDGMIITMHGEFKELDFATGKTGLRSFSRTFIIGPGIPGRNAIRVNADMLSLHQWIPLASPEADGAPAAHAAVAAPVPAPVLSPEQQKELMVAELSKRTRMTVQYSKMCLETAEWDFDRAVAVYEEKKSVLPPEAFNRA